MSKHTPGPWRAYDDDEGTLVLDFGDLCQGATQQVVFGDMEDVEGEDLANATLAADAPQLLEALEAAERILWMAREYAEAGGSHGPEMRDYREAEEIINCTLLKVRQEGLDR